MSMLLSRATRAREWIGLVQCGTVLFGCGRCSLARSLSLRQHCERGSGGCFSREVPEPVRRAAAPRPSQPPLPTRQHHHHSHANDDGGAVCRRTGRAGSISEEMSFYS
eukprot:2698072-Pleurochrysis_carterae.AAC.2